MTLRTFYAQYGLPAPHTTEEKTHTLMAEFICDNGWYEAYDFGRWSFTPSALPWLDWAWSTFENAEFRRIEDQLQELPGQIKDMLHQKLEAVLSARQENADHLHCINIRGIVFMEIAFPKTCHKAPDRHTITHATPSPWR
ncbi:hypothetical protein FN846DRAFT_903509 [Sphaerosporella brunnea]|uniref:Uncharacterized protein n=1 Tax=Sphaerosporella brunnea TaxID=1250544 RepID=A0A5J5F7F2_9PEZI|nr:hypothetical protein FN846DRAFT_903509 [Sphaerosporella brunnea]